MSNKVEVGKMYKFKNKFVEYYTIEQAPVGKVLSSFETPNGTKGVVVAFDENPTIIEKLYGPAPQECVQLFNIDQESFWQIEEVEPKITKHDVGRRYNKITRKIRNYVNDYSEACQDVAFSDGLGYLATDDQLDKCRETWKTLTEYVDLSLKEFKVLVEKSCR